MKRKNPDDFFDQILKILSNEESIHIDISDQEMEDELRLVLGKMGYKGVDPAEFMSRMRISMPVDYAVWLGFLEGHLGWDIYEAYEDPDFLEPFGRPRPAKGPKWRCMPHRRRTTRATTRTIWSTICCMILLALTTRQSCF